MLVTYERSRRHGIELLDGGCLMKKIAFSIVLLLLLCAMGEGQADSGRLAKIGDAAKDKISKEMPGWTYRSIEPVQGSKNVIIQHWELGNIAVKVAVAQWDSEAHATEALKDFKTHLRLEENAAANRGKEL